MIINNSKEVLDYISEDSTEIIFGFDNDTETWVRVQHMTIQEILESSHPFHLIRFHSKSKEDSNFLINLLMMNYGRCVVDYKQ